MTVKDKVLLDEYDRKLLNEIQTAFPVVRHPYRVLGDRIGLSEAQIMNRIAALRHAGIIRRMGASINSRRVGFVSTLCAAQVPDTVFEKFVGIVNDCPGVTHNYKRKHKYNVWFTLIAPSLEEKKQVLEKLINDTGVMILELPAKRIFKIRVDFKF